MVSDFGLVEESQQPKGTLGRAGAGWGLSRRKERKKRSSTDDKLPVLDFSQYTNTTLARNCAGINSNIDPHPWFWLLLEPEDDRSLHSRPDTFLPGLLKLPLRWWRNDPPASRTVVAHATGFLSLRCHSWTTWEAINWLSNLS